MNAENRRLVAIMFTDMVGYSKLTHQDEPLSIELLKEHRSIVRPFVTEFRGREVSTTGDGFVVEFGSTTDAVRCALEIQKAFHERNSAADTDRQIRLRIGLHIGDIFGIENDIYGDGVNIAARLQSMAPAGGISMSQAVHDQIRSTVDYPIQSIGVHRLKGIQHPMHIWVMDLKPPGRRERFKRAFFKMRKHRASAAAFAALLVAVSWMEIRGNYALDSSALDRQRIAVLPFEGSGLSVADSYIPDGLTDELISGLSRTDGVRILAKGSISRFKRDQKTPKQIGQELRVGAFLDGVVTKSGNSLQITVALVDTQSEENLWAEKFEGRTEDIYQFQRQIVDRVAGRYNLSRAPASVSESDSSASNPNSDAYLAYLRGKFFLGRRTKEGILKAIGELENSVRLDSHYAPAYAALANAAGLESYYGIVSPLDASLRVVQNATQAVALDPGSTDALMSLAEEKAYTEYDFKAAEEFFRSAINSNPRHPTAHQWYGEFLANRGRFKEALKEQDIAIQLDPMSLVAGVSKGASFYFKRDYDASIKTLKSVIEMDPSFMVTYYWIGRAYSAKQDYDSAITALTKAVELSGNEPMMLAALGHTYGAAGKRKEAAEILSRLQKEAQSRYISPYQLAEIEVGMGEKQAGLDYLDKSIVERAAQTTFLNVDPELDSLRGEVQFRKIAEQIGSR